MCGRWLQEAYCHCSAMRGWISFRSAGRGWTILAAVTQRFTISMSFCRSHCVQCYLVDRVRWIWPCLQKPRRPIYAVFCGWRTGLPAMTRSAGCFAALIRSSFGPHSSGLSPSSPQAVRAQIATDTKSNCWATDWVGICASSLTAAKSASCINQRIRSSPVSSFARLDTSAKTAEVVTTARKWVKSDASRRMSLTG